MHHTRRMFIGTAAAIGMVAATGARADPPGSAVRMSLSSFCQNPSRVASLRRGIAAMKVLPASDHRSWFFQSAIHAYSDELFSAELKRDSGLKAVDAKKYWNKCPHFGQSSADFLLWHRAYLHNFEGILGAMANDPTLAIPYWDYSRADQRTFPEIFAPQFVDSTRTQPNPLYHPNRELSFVLGMLEISGVVGQAEKTVEAENFFHEVGTVGFGGDNLDSDHTLIGLLEQRPHNDIHLAVGGVINSTNGAMAEITTAAFDPVFWVHHANIDRMWAEWASKPGKRWGPLPSDSWFDERPWTFLDFDGNEKVLSRRDALGLLANYDVEYPQLLTLAAASSPPVREGTAPPPPGVTSAGSSDMPTSPAPTGSPPMIGAHANQNRSAERELLADTRPISVSPHKPIRRQIGPTPAPHKTLGSTTNPKPSVLSAPELADPNAKILLELSGITFKRVPSSGFAVFLDGGQRQSSDPVGLIDIFGATHAGAGMQTMAGMPTMKSVQLFDVTRVVENSTGPFVLRVEPYDLLVTSAGKPGASRDDAIEIKQIRFAVVS